MTDEAARARLRSELNALNSVLQEFTDGAPAELSPEWMALQSLLQRQEELLHEARLLEGVADVRVTLLGGAESRHLIDADFLGAFLRDFQGAVAAIVQVVMHGASTERGQLPGDVLAASALRVAATPAGSFEVLLDGPIARGAQLTIEGELEVAPFDEAVEQVLNVIDGATGENLTERLQGVVADIESERALGHIRSLAHSLASTGTAAAIVQRTPTRDTPREARITATNAERLQQFLERTDQTTDTVYRIGQLSGVRWTSGSFDLEVEGQPTEVVRGRVVRDLRDAIRPAFDTRVRAELQRTVTRTPGAPQGRVRWLLVGLSQPPVDS